MPSVGFDRLNRGMRPAKRLAAAVTDQREARTRPVTCRSTSRERQREVIDARVL